MTDHLDIHERLHQSGTAFRNRPIPPVPIVWPSTPVRRRLIAPAVIAATVALVVAAIAIGVHIRGSAAPASPAKPTPAPALPATPDPDFAVATPPNDQLIGGGPFVGAIGPACAPGTLRLTAATRVTADGVAGVISMTDHECNITVDPASIRLLDALGRPLKVSTGKGNSVNAPEVITSYNFGSPTVTVYAGADKPRTVNTTSRIGYAWNGTYCGPAPASVELRINGRPMTVPLTGPGLPCRWHNASELVPGTLAGLGRPVVPAPVSWKALRARLVLPSTFTPGPIPVVVVLTNTGHAPVALSDPCPTALSFGTLRSGGGLAGFGGPQGNLCDRPRVLAPGASTTLTMPSIDFPSTKNFPQLDVQSGDELTVTWSIAGVPTATATAHIR